MDGTINDTILALIEQNPDSVLRSLAARVKARRLELDLTQKALAARAGLTFATYRRFESSGEISLRNLLKLALALDAVSGFEQLFTERRYESLDALLKSNKSRERKRGRRND